MGMPSTLQATGIARRSGTGARRGPAGACRRPAGNHPPVRPGPGLPCTEDASEPPQGRRGTRDGNEHLRGGASREPRRQQLLRPVPPETDLCRRDRRRPVRVARATRLRGRTRHEAARQLRRPRGDLATVFRREGLRNGPRRRAHPRILRGVPRDAARRVRGVRTGPRARRSHRRQRRQPGAPAVPVARRRRHPDPGGRRRTAAPGGDRVGEGRGCLRLLRVGVVPLTHQPGAPRRDRTGRDRLEGTLQPSRRRGRAASSADCRTRPPSPPTSSSTPPWTCGASRRSRRAALGTRLRFLWSCRSG